MNNKTSMIIIILLAMALGAAATYLYLSDTQPEVEESALTTYEEMVKAEEIREAAVVNAEQRALDENDESICEEIDDENEQASCKFNVISSKVSESKDASLCDEIGKEPFVQACKESLSVEE